jgi:serine/threonine protein kinase
MLPPPAWRHGSSAHKDTWIVSEQSSPITVFFSYAPEDAELGRELTDHLALLEKQGVISGWHARDIGAGEEWRRAIDERLETAKVILLMISADYMASDYYYDVEMRRALERHNAGAARVIAILLRAYDMAAFSLANVPTLPSGQRPVTSWSNRDEAWADVVQAVRREIEGIHGPRVVNAQPTGRTPIYRDAQTQLLSERIESARARKEALDGAGQSSAAVRIEILDLRRQIREGGQVREGDSLTDGRYLLLNQVGRGGFATVWRALDRDADTFVAIKVLHTNLAADPVRRERFFRGARVMAGFQNETICRVLDQHGEDGGFFYFVMDLVDGLDLNRAVLRKQVPSDKILQIILAVGDALAEAHEGGIIHRDVKPSNVLLGEGYMPRLTDFDLVAVGDTTGGTRTGAMGTFLYAAPECMDRPQDAEASADIYGLGMTAIFCLYGNTLPNSSFGHTEKLVKELFCGSHVKSVLSRSVAWDKEKRPANGRAFCKELLGAVERQMEDDRRAKRPPMAEIFALEHARQQIASALDRSRGVRPPPEATTLTARNSSGVEYYFKIDAEVRDDDVGDLSNSYVGTTFDSRYKIEKLIGRGGMGVVYLARHITIDKRVAIKVIRPQMATPREALDRSLREAKVASSIDSPHIVDISDFGKLSDGSAYFVMEYLDGQTLGQLLRSARRPSLERICHIVQQVANGLAAAHERGVVHLDLKPDNVVLIRRGSDNDFVKVLDFGLARVAGVMSESDSVGMFGTPYYMSPEQVMGAPVDARADIYSLGVMLYELVSGRVPFEAENAGGVLTQHMYVEPVPIRELVPTPECSPSLDAVVLKCLEKRRDARYQSMGELANDLKRVDEGGAADAVERLLYASRSRSFSLEETFLIKEMALYAPGSNSPLSTESRWPSVSAVPTESRWPFAFAVGAISLSIGSLLPLPFRAYIVPRRVDEVVVSAATPAAETKSVQPPALTVHSTTDPTGAAASSVVTPAKVGPD